MYSFHMHPRTFSKLAVTWACMSLKNDGCSIEADKYGLGWEVSLPASQGGNTFVCENYQDLCTLAREVRNGEHAHV